MHTANSADCMHVQYRLPVVSVTDSTCRLVLAQAGCGRSGPVQAWRYSPPMSPQQSAAVVNLCIGPTRYNRLSNPLSNRLSNRFDNGLYRLYKHSAGCQTLLTTGLTKGCIVYTAVCQTGFTTRFDNRLNEQLFVQHGCQPFDNRLDVCLHDTAGCQTGCTTRLTTACDV